MREQADRTYPIHEDMRFQRRTWIVERLGWGLLGLLACAALAGLFGHGPLGTVTANAPGNTLSIQYERFQRVTRLARFTFTLDAAAGDPAVLQLSPSFQQAYEITSVQPAPVRSSAGADGLQLAFAPSGIGNVAVVVWAHPRQFGRLDLQARTATGDPTRFPVLVYP
jgi:hypothetical protein